MNIKCCHKCWGMFVEDPAWTLGNCCQHQYQVNVDPFIGERGLYARIRMSWDEVNDNNRAREFVTRRQTNRRSLNSISRDEYNSWVWETFGRRNNDE